MAYNVLGCDRGQDYLLPVSVTDWLPEGHLAYFVLDAVDQIDLSGFFAGYGGTGTAGRRITTAAWTTHRDRDHATA